MRLRHIDLVDWESEALPIYVRCFTREASQAETAKQPQGAKRARPRTGPNDLVLIFDTETTVDAAQRLRVLFYQLRAGGDLDEERAAYDPAALTAAELKTLRAYCAARGLPDPMTVDEFREQVLLGMAYDCGAEIVGFNLPFDIARIAIDAAAARVTRWSRKMQNGFSFKISDNPRRPRLRVKLLGPRSAVFEFAAEYRQRTARSSRQRGDYTPVHRGHFTDVRTLAAALTSRNHSLKSLTRALGTPTQKTESDEHGGPLTAEYLDYARADVQATWECFQALTTKFASYGLGGAHWELFSEASIGKATLSALGVKPWLAQNPSVAPELISQSLSSYYGGRTEVRWRKTVREVFHTDFTSMYPTVCTLMGLWRFITATGFETYDATDEARSLLAAATAAGLQAPDAWRQLPMLVRIAPDHDLLPVRAPYCREKNATIGLNYLACAEPLWFTLADCLVAKIHTGKAPEVLEAVGFRAGPLQPSLKPLTLFGAHPFDPRADDLFRRLIQLRIQEKARAPKLEGVERANVEDLCQSLKITANSTSYGIFVQVNVEQQSDATPIEVFRPDGRAFVDRCRKVERPGPFFHPLLATLITGAARLMLALAEHRAEAEGLDWVFCDTDSLALARPGHMAAADFEAAAARVVAWFTPLDPYGTGKSILKPEDANFVVGGGAREPLYCLAISSKRYALFNIGPEDGPIIRKASAHGLGHLRAPYGEDDPAASISAGAADLPRWQRDLWHTIVQAALRGELDSVRYDFHPALRRPAISRYAANNPELWRWFDSWNEGRGYADSVKPFGFLYALHAKPGSKGLHPIAPFGASPESSIGDAFDRVTGASIAKRHLQTYAEALAGYHLAPESKFRGGEAFDAGRTERRHIRAVGVELIGKEADRFEERIMTLSSDEVAIRYGASPDEQAELVQELAGAAAEFGDAAVARTTGLSRGTVAKVRTGVRVRIVRSPAAVRAALESLRVAGRMATSAEQSRLTELQRAVEEHGGVRRAAAALGIDASNLSKKLALARSQE